MDFIYSSSEPSDLLMCLLVFRMLTRSCWLRLCWKKEELQSVSGWSDAPVFQRLRYLMLRPAPQFWDSNGGSLGGGIFTSDGSTPQISRAYWEMVRSLENFPEAAMLRITILVHSVGFWVETEDEELCQKISSSLLKTDHWTTTPKVHFTN